MEGRGHLFSAEQEHCPEGQAVNKKPGIYMDLAHDGAGDSEVGFSPHFQ